MALASGRHGARRHSITSSPGVATRHFKPRLHLKHLLQLSSELLLTSVVAHCGVVRPWLLTVCSF
ncbi:hypothetical protein DY000_02025126 [Brassica cretica]|uniref:Uncharacterized protein n=1 Tax=Brassica cretica TaxID=69181 RepID=A0ABQ7EG68_BRACR|nr:hypothetical protein DY000_02025126 [Brassica cretica]